MPSDSASAVAGEPVLDPLLQRLRHGDADAFAEIVAGWSPMMLRLARAYVSSDASAQEVVQETWLAVVKGLDRFEGRSSVRTWVLSILRNIGKSRGVREARTLPWSSLQRDEDDGPAVDPDRFRGPDDPWPGHWTPVGSPRRWEATPEDASLASEVWHELTAALAGLPDRQRTVVGLRDVHGLSSAEVCSLLGLTPGNERVLLHRGRSRLRSRLEEYRSSQAHEVRG